MSLFILDIPYLATTTQDLHPHQQQHHATLAMLKAAVKPAENYLINTNHQPAHPNIEFKFIIPISPLLQIIYALSFNFGGQKQRINVKILFKGQYLNSRSSEISKSLLRIIAKVHLFYSKSPYTYVIDPKTNQICLRVGYMGMIVNRSMHKSAMRLAKEQAVNFISESIAIILFNANLISRLQIHLFNPTLSKDYFFGPHGYFSRIRDIQEYLLLVNCSMDINQESENPSDDFYYYSTNCDKIIQDKYEHPSSFYQSNCHILQLFALPFPLSINNPYNKKLNKEAFYKLLSAPPAPQTDDPTPHNYLFNSIRTISLDNQKRIIRNEGGWAQILIMLIRYVFVDSVNPIAIGQNRQIEESMARIQTEGEPVNQITSPLAIKIPKATSNQKLFQNMKNKIKYQKQVLTNLRTSRCQYLPKYYHSTQRNFQFKEFLMIEFLNGVNLSEELESKKIQISLQFKIHILLQISAAIRFLQRHKIAHLDLSLNNIMICKGQRVKIIDFGQAYHAKISKKYSRQDGSYIYRPGRSSPFAPPETSIRNIDFTSQQDIYTLGVILHRLFFGTYHILCPSQKLFASYIRQNYLSMVFLAPERGDYYIQSEVWMILINLMMKMYAYNENQRPFPIWTQALLKKIYLLLL